MLPKPHRLTNVHAFYQGPKTGHKAAGDYALCIIKSQTEAAPSRFAFVVSKKISKAAVRRNRTRRLLREAVHSQLVDTAPGYDIVCVAKQDLSEVPLQAIVADMTRIFRSANIVK